MDIFSIPLSELREDPANARKHGQRNIAAIKASLDRFGQQTPIVVDSDNVVRKGNGTFRAAKELGWEGLACVRTWLDGAEAKAYAIADNRTGDLAEWDELVLAETIKGIQSEDDEALSLATGFDEDEVDELMERLAAEHAGPEVLDELPNIKASESHVITLRYTDADEPALREFIGQEDDGPLSPQAGKAILGRIKEFTEA